MRDHKGNGLTFGKRKLDLSQDELKEIRAKEKKIIKRYLEAYPQLVSWIAERGKYDKADRQT